MADPTASFPARIWIRVDALEPLACSVRFSLHEGEGYLEWGHGPTSGPRGVSRTGAAGGLSAVELPRLELVVPARQERHALKLSSLPAGARTSIGSWVEVELDAEPEGDVTDLVFAIDVLETGHSGLEPDVAEIEESAPPPVAVVAFDDEPDELDTDLTASPPAPPAPTVSQPGSAGSALVRSLVQRIRQQEEEIKSLKAQLAALQAR